LSDLPDIQFNLDDRYAVPLGHNFDTIQECFCMEMPPALAARLESGKNAALEAHEGQGALFGFGGEDFQIWTSGSQGNRWVIANDDLQIHFRTDKPGWHTTVRYLAAGLWEYGVDALKARVIALLKAEMKPQGEKWITLSRADYAFDFYSPAFTSEMKDGSIRSKLVLTSGVKAGLVFSALRDETLTIGVSKSAGLQIQVYDKGQELLDKPGKEWMFKIWEREGYHPPEEKKAKHVWRVEVRLKKEFLKDRRISTLEVLRENLKELLCEALMRRRMCIPEDNPHRERWALHPLWSAVWSEAGEADKYIPLGRQIMMTRGDYRQMLMAQMAGLGRSVSMVEINRYDRTLAERNGLRSVDLALKDPRHKQKLKRCEERQRFIDEAG
jgi:hypothetical protein